MMTDWVASRSNYAAQRRRSPGAMAAAIALNGGVVGLLLAMPAAKYIIDEPGILIGRNIEATKPPPPVEDPIIEKRKPIETQSKTATKADDKPFVNDPILPSDGGLTLDGKTGLDPVIGTGNGGVITEPVDPPHVPVFVQTRLDPRFADSFKPDYPLDMRRLGKEGNVTVRVMVNEKGRVVGVELVKASDPSFFEAAKRQALGRWRFVPATRDGKAVGSELTLTLTFRLEDE
jgi:protein TonB